MRYSGQPSWQMWVSSPQGLLVGLYVREAAGMRPATAVDLPPLDPPVELRAGLAPLAVPEAARQWVRWWEGELARQEGPERGFFAPDRRFDGEELGALVHACYDDAHRWAALSCHDEDQAHLDGEGGSGAEGDLVRAVEAELGRKARPFRLTVTQLPLADAVGWRPSPHHLLVSRALRSDPDAYARWLTPVLRE
ncbi:MAG: hypothetical protein HOY69_20610, partial [Streptomyces sp.]|nr:hypothetical protein [Streptomyces sp.]